MDSNNGGIVLWDTKKLYEKYETFNHRYFNNRLPQGQDIVIEWSTRLTSSAGNCRVLRNTFKRNAAEVVIRLSVHYHQNYPQEIEVTLLHEMIHILVPGHGPEFKRWVNQINAQGGTVVRHSKEPAAQPKWEYQCLNCGTKIYRRRRFKRLATNAFECKYCGGLWSEKKLR